jgi:hypothetical protein
MRADRKSGAYTTNLKDLPIVKWWKVSDNITLRVCE